MVHPRSICLLYCIVFIVTIHLVLSWFNRDEGRSDKNQQEFDKSSSYNDDENKRITNGTTLTDNCDLIYKKIESLMLKRNSVQSYQDNRISDIFFSSVQYDQVKNSKMDLDFDKGINHDLASQHTLMKILKKVTDTSKKGLIIEVGSWKGQSTIELAKMCKHRDCEVLAVDTWLGSPGFFTHPDLKENFISQLQNGISFYHVFLNNIFKSKMSHIVTPFRFASGATLHVLEYYSIMADIIYIDGDHSYAGAFQDITNFWNVLKPGGILAGHDYHLMTIKNALHSFFQNVPVYSACAVGSEWIILRES